jgi:uridylate kinase
MKKVIVLSLGGSLIVPGKIDIDFLEKFRKVLLKNRKKYRFVVVCGGGSTARNYIKGLEDEKSRKKVYLQSMMGIASTRMNARFMTYFFGKDANRGIPHEMKEVKDSLRKNDIVFCGALRYEVDQTSDSTAVKLARFLRCDFVNLTNVKGLYEKNPKRFRSAKFIPEISSKDFLKRARKIEFHPGQHFVLDQTAARIVHKYGVRSFILGEDMDNLDRFLNGRHYVGTVID